MTVNTQLTLDQLRAMNLYGMEAYATAIMFPVHEHLGAITLLCKLVKLIDDDAVVDVVLDFQRIVLHRRIVGRRGIFSPVAEHGPESHRHYHEQQGWTEADVASKAATVGLCTEEAVRRILSSKAFVQQSIDACFGIHRRQKKCGTNRLKAACGVAPQAPGVSCRLVHNILEKNRDNAEMVRDIHTPMRPVHEQSEADTLQGKLVKLSYDEAVVEVFLDFQRIALHQRIVGRRGIYSTVPEDMPESHRRYHEQQGWTEEDVASKAAVVGPCTEDAVRWILSSKAFVQQSFDACFGTHRLQKKCGTNRLEAACGVALQVPSVSYRLVHNIIEKNRDKAEIVSENHAPMLPLHTSIHSKEVYN